MESLERGFNPEKTPPPNYEEILAQLDTKNSLQRELLHLLVIGFRNGKIETPEQFSRWTKKDFSALLNDLGHSDLEFDKKKRERFRKTEEARKELLEKLNDSNDLANLG